MRKCLIASRKTVTFVFGLLSLAANTRAQQKQQLPVEGMWQFSLGYGGEPTTQPPWQVSVQIVLTDANDFTGFLPNSSQSALTGQVLYTGTSPSGLLLRWNPSSVPGIPYPEYPLYEVTPSSDGTSMQGGLASGYGVPEGLSATLNTQTGNSTLPQFAFGGGWYSALYFTNSSAAQVSFPVTFTSDNGSPLTVPSIGGPSTTVNLPPHGTAVIEAPNVGTLSQGYATTTLPAGVTGYGVFRATVPGIPDQEAVVPLASVSSRSSTLIWDDTNYTTAVAIANPTAMPVTVSINVWNDSGSVIGTSSIFLTPGAKTEAALRSLQGLSGVAGSRGSAQFSVASGSIAVLGLRFNGPAFTSIPTLQQ